MSNPFEIAANTMSLAPRTATSTLRPGPKLKPLAQRKNSHALQLARRDAIPISTTTEGFLAKFKADEDNESEPESSENNDLRRRSYSRSQLTIFSL